MVGFRGYPPEGSSLVVVAGSGVVISVSGNTYTISATGGNVDATYITYDDETGTFANSRKLEAGNNVTLDDSGGILTINAQATGGGAPTTPSYVTISSEAALANERALSEGYGISLVDNGAGSTVDIGLSTTFLALPFLTIGNQSGLTGERAITIGEGLSGTDAGAGSSYTLANSSSGFSTVKIAGQSDVVAYLLQDQLELVAGSNVTITSSGSSITIAATDTGEANQNAFGTVSVSGQSDIVSDDPEDVLNIASGTGIALTTDAGTDTLTISNTSSSFNTIQVSGQSDVVADALQDTLTFVAGSNVTITTSGDSITISSTDTNTQNPDQNLFETIQVSGQSDIVADSTTDTLTFAEGDGVEITTNASTDTITITNTASSFNQIVVSGQSDIIASQILNSFEVAAGTGITLTTAGSTLTVTNSSPNVVQNVFTTFAVSGQSDVVADSDTDTITFVEGEGMEITTNAGSDSITLTNNSSGFSKVKVSGQNDVDAYLLQDQFSLVEGSNITITTSGSDITIASSAGGSQNLFETISVAGQSDIVADSTTDTLTVEAGDGIDLTTNASTDTLTITNSSSGFSKIKVAGQSDVDAYLLQDQFALEAGANVTITTSGSTINIASAGATGGSGAPTDSEYIVVSVDGTLTDERALAVGEGLSLSDGGAGNNITLANTASSFGTVVVENSSSINSEILQGQFGLVGGTNVTLSVSGTSITIDATDTNTQNPDQNLFETISVAGQSDIVADSTTDTLTIANGTGIDVTTTPGTDTLTIANTASGFAKIKVSGQSDVDAYLLQDQFELAEGSNVTITTSGSTITIAATDTGDVNQNAFSNVAVSGQNTVVADSATDTVTLVEGAGVEITTNDTTDSITISNTSSSFNTIQVSGQSDVVADALQDTLTFVAGSNVTITTSGDNITFSSTDTGDVNQNAFTTVAVSGESDVVADTETDTLTLVAGTGIGITTNAGSDSVTITNSSPNTDQNLFETIRVPGWSDVVAGSSTGVLHFEGSGGFAIGTNASTDTVVFSATGLQPLDATLTSLSAYNTNGILTQTSPDTFVGRTITGTASSITVVDGDGVSGNPTISISSNPVLSGTAGMVIPKGTTAQRTATEGMLRYNEDDNVFEGYDNDSWVQFGAGGAGGTVLNSTAGGRLTLTSATPVTTSDVTAATTLYYSEHSSNQIALYDGSSSWSVLTFSNISLSLSGLTANTNYDIFCYNNSGTATLEATAWSSDTARATALARQDGVYVRSGSTTRRYLGTIRITGTTGQCEDSLSKRFVFNHQNKIIRRLSAKITTNSWTYASTTYRAWNADTAYGSTRVGLVIGVSENIATLEAILNVGYDSVGAGVGIGVDSTSTNSADLFNYLVVYYSPGGLNIAALDSNPGVGFHYYQALETAGNTHTAYGDNGSTTMQSGLRGRMLM